MNMFEKIREILISNPESQEKFFLLVAGAMLTLFFTKIVPATYKSAKDFTFWIGKLIGGKFSHRFFRQQYLDWLVTDLQELRLTGIVSAEDSKRPKLDQVYLSLRFDNAAAPPSTDNVVSTGGVAKYGVSTWKDVAELLQIHSDCHTPSLQKLNSSLTTNDALSKSFKLARKLARRRPGLLALVGKLTSSGFRLLKKESTVARKEQGTAIESNLKQREEHAVLQWLAENKSAIEASFGDFQLRYAFQKHERIAILGGPGAGKTTMLQHIALTFAREKAGDAKLRRKGNLRKVLGSTPWRVPIFIRLSSVASQLATKNADKVDYSILDVLASTLPPDLQAFPGVKSYFSTQLEKGKCVVLLDGLDEVPSDHEFAAVTRAIKSMAVRYPENKYIITSRIAGWRSGLGIDFFLSYVEDLSDVQIRTFVDAWYSAVERNAVPGRLDDESSSETKSRERRAVQSSSNLKTALQTNIGIRRLATNPMLLSIIAVVHRSLATLPRERSKLYNQCSQILLEQWDISRGLRVDDTGLRLEQKQLIMRRLAYALHTGEIGDNGGGREASVTQLEQVIAELLPGLGKSPEMAAHLLRRLLERSGLLIERSRGRISFAHHTFQEYFAAQHLAALGVELGTAFLVHPNRILADWWREVALLFSGLLPDSSVFVQSIERSSGSDVFLQRIRMAALCAGESVTISDNALRHSLTNQLLAIMQAQEATKLPQTSALGDFALRQAKSSDWLMYAALTTQRTTPEVLEQCFSVAVESNGRQLSKEEYLAFVSCLSEGRNVKFSPLALRFLQMSLRETSRRLTPAVITALGRTDVKDAMSERVDILSTLFGKPSYFARLAAKSVGRLLNFVRPTQGLITELKQILKTNPLRANSLLSHILRLTKKPELLVFIFDEEVFFQLKEFVSSGKLDKVAGSLGLLAWASKTVKHREEILKIIALCAIDDDERTRESACQAMRRVATETNPQQVAMVLLHALQSNLNTMPVERWLNVIARLSFGSAPATLANVVAQYLQKGSRKTRMQALRAVQALHPRSSFSGRQLIIHMVKNERSPELRALSLQTLVRLNLTGNLSIVPTTLILLRARSIEARALAADAVLHLSRNSREPSLCGTAASFLPQELAEFSRDSSSMKQIFSLGRRQLRSRARLCRALAEVFVDNAMRAASAQDFSVFWQLCCNHTWLVNGSSDALGGLEEIGLMSEYQIDFPGDVDESLFLISPGYLSAYLSFSYSNPNYEIVVRESSQVLTRIDASSEPVLRRKLRELIACLPSEVVLKEWNDVFAQDKFVSKILVLSLLASFPYVPDSLVGKMIQSAIAGHDKQLVLAACIAAGCYAKGSKDLTLFNALQSHLDDSDHDIQKKAWEAISFIFSAEQRQKDQSYIYVMAPSTT